MYKEQKEMMTVTNFGLPKLANAD
uniref:Uncharacterized protein n=1 Tax=Arundo donax TaxID=35708 RepID=A0A0A9FVA9_ARUDO